MRKLLLTLAMSAALFAGDTTLKIKVTGMTCPSCVKNVKNAISSVNGVKEAKVYLKDGKAEVVCADSVKPTDVVDAIKKDGYGAELIK